MGETEQYAAGEKMEAAQPVAKGGLPADGNCVIYQRAHELFTHQVDWVRFFREILGARGLVRRHYPTPQTLAEFERTETYTAIQQMLTKLRRRNTKARQPQEPIRVITVRLPKSLHETLRQEATLHNSSINKVCISQLLQCIDSELVPEGKQPEPRADL